MVLSDVYCLLLDIEIVAMTVFSSAANSRESGDARLHGRQTVPAVTALPAQYIASTFICV